MRYNYMSFKCTKFCALKWDKQVATKRKKRPQQTDGTRQKGRHFVEFVILSINSDRNRYEIRYFLPTLNAGRISSRIILRTCCLFVSSSSSVSFTVRSFTSIVCTLFSFLLFSANIRCSALDVGYLQTEKRYQ